MDAKTVLTPIARHFKLSSSQSSQTDEELQFMSKTPYVSATGSLMYAMVCSRPDIAYAASIVSRFMGNLGKKHWLAVKWIFKYLKGTKSVGLTYGRSKAEMNGLAGYVNADYAGDLDKRRPTKGYLFTLYGGVVSWKANLQSIVALSSTKSEYIALTESIKEAIWLKGIVNELEGKTSAITVWCDSQSVIFLSKNPLFHERTKHIDTRLHYI